MAYVVEFGQEDSLFAQTGGHFVEHGTQNADRYLLFQSGEAGTFLAIDGSEFGCQFTGDEFHQGGFSGTVTAQEAHAFSALDLQVDSLEKGRSAVTGGDVKHIE